MLSIKDPVSFKHTDPGRCDSMDNSPGREDNRHTTSSTYFTVTLAPSTTPLPLTEYTVTKYNVVLNRPQLLI